MEFRRNGMIRLRLFWARRARRLLPALLLVLGFVALYNHLVVTPWQREGVRGDMVASLFYVANWRFIVDKLGYFELFSESSPLRHMWSLAIEEQYYLIWPPVVIVCIMLGKGRLKVLATVVGDRDRRLDDRQCGLRFRPGDVVERLLRDRRPGPHVPLRRPAGAAAADVDATRSQRARDRARCRSSP